MRLAKTCSTCTFAVFGNSAWRGGRKNQAGQCYLYTGLPPDKPVIVAPEGCDLVGAIKSYWYGEDVEIPTEEKYVSESMKKLQEAIDLYKRRAQAGGWQKERNEKRIEKLSTISRDDYVDHYHKCIWYASWWRGNIGNIRLCHRTTVCDMYVDAGMPRESWARQVADGSRVLTRVAVCPECGNEQPELVGTGKTRCICCRSVFRYDTRS